jgi:hypothetical protein
VQISQFRGRGSAERWLSSPGRHRILAKIAHKVKPAADDPFGERMRRWFADYDALVTAT